MMLNVVLVSALLMFTVSVARVAEYPEDIRELCVESVKCFKPCEDLGPVDTCVVMDKPYHCALITHFVTNMCNA